jgi:hypothetical protein
VRPFGTHQRWLRQHRRSLPSWRTLRVLVLAVVLSAVLLGTAGAAAAASSNPIVVGSTQNATSLSGAGYVAVSGNYAYTAGYYAGTITVVDISNPLSPKVVGQTPFSNALLSASHLTVVGSTLYVVSQNRNGPSGTNSNDDGTGNSLVIVDISNPTSPTIVGTPLHNSNLMFSPHGVAVSGSYAFVAAQGCISSQPCPNASVGNAFVVVDESNPSNPTIVASIQNSNLPAPWTGSGALLHACSVTISGNYAYVTASYAKRLTIIDISNPTAPTIVGSVQDTTNLPLPVDVAVQNGYAYVANQVPSGATNAPGTVTVVDVHSPTSPQIVGTLANSALNGAYRIRVRSNFAYVAAVSASATDVVDISDPAHPRLAATLASTSLLNHTVGVDLDPTAQYAISTSGWLSTETRTLYPPFPLQPGGPTATGTVSAISLDPTPIGVSIGSGPGNTTTATTAQFAFSTTDAVSTVRCSLDGAPFGLCSTATSQSYGGLAAGPHTFTVKAIDAADRTATASYGWTITVPTLIDPTTPVLDNFNRANGTAGSNWSLIKPSGFAPMNVSGNTAVDSSGSAYAWNYWNPSSFGPDVEAYATVANYPGSTAGTIRIGARVTPGSSYSGYFVSISPTNGGTWSIVRVDNGQPAVTPPSETPVTQALASGDKIGIRISGSVITALHYTSAGGWGQVLSYNTSSDTPRYTSAGNIAIEFLKGAIDDVGGGTIAAPANTGPPTVSGTVAIGQQLQANPGTWSGTPAAAFSYQWQDCNSGGGNCSPIVDATASSYTIQPSDGGHTLNVVVTGANSDGSSQASSAATVVVPQPPVNTLAPTVSGTVAVGQQLQASTGNWSGTPSPTFTYQWLDCDSAAIDCNPIQGATASSYTIQASDVGFALDVVVTGSNNVGSSQAASGPTIVVPRPPQAPVNIQAPQISGTVAVGQQLQADPGNWSGTPSPTFTYQWLDCDSGGFSCSAIVGATGTSYTIQGSDGGFALEVVVTGSNTAGSSQAASAPTSVVPPQQQAPVNVQQPSVSGTIAVGQQLQASPGTWTGTPAPTFTYQWQDCDASGNNCSPIAGATASSYTIQSADVGDTLEVAVTGSNSSGSSQAVSPPTSVVPQAPVNITPPQISGTVAVGQQLTADPGSWSGTPAPTFTYQWQDCDSGGNSCNPIAGATASSYTVQTNDDGYALKVVVTGSNSGGSSQAASAPTALVPQAPVNIQPPLVSGTVAVGQQLQASPGTWNGTPTFTYQWQDCAGDGSNCVSIAGATASSYTIQGSDGGFALEVVVTGSNSGGSSQAASAPTAAVPQAPANTQAPQISGTVVVGQQLQATTGNWTGTPPPTFTYQWQSCDSGGNNCSPIQGATASSYTIQAADVGHTLEVVVTGSNNVGSSQAASAPTVVVTQAPVNIGLPQISGTVAVGLQLQTTAGNWNGAPAPTFTYQWQDCNSSGNNCSPIAGATASTYTIQTADGGFTLEVVVTGSNSAGSSQAASAPTAVVTKPPATPVLDNFNRANGAVGSKWTAIKPSGFALMNVLGNTAVDSSSSQYAWNYWNPTTFGPDVEAYATVASYAGNGTIRIGARITPGSSYSGYFVSISPTSGGTWSIIRVDNGGSPVTLPATPVTQALASGDKIGIRIVGSVVTALHYTASGGWQQVLSYNTSSDTTRYTGSGSIAIEFLHDALDDFGGGSI